MAMDLKLWIVVVADLGTLLLALLLGVSILSPNLWQNPGSDGFSDSEQNSEVPPAI